MAAYVNHDSQSTSFERKHGQASHLTMNVKPRQTWILHMLHKDLLYTSAMPHCLLPPPQHSLIALQVSGIKSFPTYGTLHYLNQTSTSCLNLNVSDSSLRVAVYRQQKDYHIQHKGSSHPGCAAVPSMTPPHAAIPGFL